jgi:Domain of unknown function (DUF4394)
MKKMFFYLGLGMIVFNSCKKNNDVVEDLATGEDQIVFAINNNNELLKFNAKAPSQNLSRVNITGINTTEKIISIDFRPATGELYGLANSSRLYIINQNTGTSRLVNTASFTPAISGSIVNIDFNPTVDRIRLVSNNGQNLRLNPETGLVVSVDANINGVSNAEINGIAYTNSKAGNTTTTLYDIDNTTGKLYIQNPPNNGALVEVGRLDILFYGNTAFDIAPNNSAYLGTNNNFYSVNLSTGKAIKINTLSEPLLDIAIPTEAVAYAVDGLNNLLIFNPFLLSKGSISKTITGLQANEKINGIDFRPLNGQLYALGSSNRLYSLNLSNGAATQVGTTTFSTALTGTDFGFDFNPTVDRIRVISNTGQNLRLNPIDGTVAAVDLPLNPGIPLATSAAYTNNFVGTTSTSLFVIDQNTDKLYLQNPPNNGTLVEIGNLGIDIDNNNGFDISSRTNLAYLMATVGGITNLYTINLTTGAASSPASFSTPVRGFAIANGF